MPTLRLLAVNAQTLPQDRDGLTSLIAAEHPDVACVHGSPSLLRWRSISAALARRSGLVVVSGGRTGGANLIMSSLGVDVGATRDLRFAGASGLRPPGATLAVLRLLGSEFVFAAARLVGNSAERLAQADEVQAAIRGLGPGDLPVIVSAEGSDRPGTAAWQALTENRVAVGGGVFVDTRIVIGASSAVENVTALAPKVTVELTLPDA